MKRCLGCGEVLQNTDKDKKGYVVNLDNDYCLRCFKIRHYNELIETKDINQTDFLKAITELISNATKEDHFFYILDIFNLDASRIKELEAKLDSENTTIVVNKIDLMPHDVSFDNVMDYVSEIFSDSKLKDAEIVLISSEKNWGVDELRESLLEYKNNYFIGKTNVGKSSIINALMRSIGEKSLITTSYFENTTLDTIQIELNENSKIIDTPGIADSNSFLEITMPEDWKLLYFRKPLKQFSFNIFSNQSFIYGSIFSINFQLVDKRDIHIYANQFVDLHRTNTNNLEDYYDKNFDKAVPRVNVHNKLVTYELNIDDKWVNKQVSISIENLGWISLTLKLGDKINYTIPSDKIKPVIDIRNKFM